MGSFIEINDTLQITKEQGFPKELEYEKHKFQPYTAEEFKNVVFEFFNKPNIRIYHRPPVRNFLVENINDKWLYWGLVHILEINHDYVKGVTSGKYKIIYINTPDEMKHTHNIIDRNSDTKYI